MFEIIRDQVVWEQPAPPGQNPMPRKTKYMVAGKCTCKYGYGSIWMDPHPFPPWMDELMETYMPLCGLQRSEWPDCCNLNLYESGWSSVAWHADDEPLFNGKNEDICIISLSLGQERTFSLKYLFPENHDISVDKDHREEPIHYQMPLGHGDLCTMEGMTQKHMHHAVLKENGRKGARINLTWRWIRVSKPDCPQKPFRR
jgi:alkylated DNA repair dioxygenase AlkB